MKSIKLYLLFIVIPIVGFTQDKELNLNQLTIPSAPAYTIMGVQPNEISKPKTSDALELSLYSNFFDKSNNVTLPKNYALEFSPYWLKAKPSLTFKEYSRPNFCQSLKQNSAISFASFEQTSLKDSLTKNIRMGIGYRTNFNLFDISIRDKQFTKDVNEVKEVKELHLITRTITLLISQINSEPDTLNKEDLKKYYNDFILLQIVEKPEIKIYLERFNPIIKKIIDDKYETDKKNLKTLIIEEVKKYEKLEKDLRIKITEMIRKEQSSGLKLEVAGAFIIDYPTNDIGFSNVPKFAVWLSPSYNSTGSKWHFLGMLRYIKSSIADDYTDNLDLGCKILYRNNKFSLSGEYIQRNQKKTLATSKINNVSTITTESAYDFKATLNLGYELSDKITLGYSFGQNFVINNENIGNLVSLLSINYGLGIVNTSNIK
jgi:hypothetical protein